jgi:hypothetical protein
MSRHRRRYPPAQTALRRNQGPPTGAFFISAQAGDVMPFDPDFPFAPANPSQWWQTRALPHILVQPNAPANEGSTNPADSDGIDDWFVPFAWIFRQMWMEMSTSRNTIGGSPGTRFHSFKGKSLRNFKHRFKSIKRSILTKARFQFSEQPPPSVVQAIEQVGGAYIVKPDP